MGIAFQGPVWGTSSKSENTTCRKVCNQVQQRKQWFASPLKISARDSGYGQNCIVCTSSVKPEAVGFSTKGLSVEDFFERSIGEWRSQRSSHNLAWTQFEQITSEITISKLENTDGEVVQLCEANKVDVNDTIFSMKMSWEGESDWDEDEVNEGESVMSVLKDGERHGRLLRSVGYAETIPAVGHWEMTEEGVFVLNTLYDAAGAEERIWFATPDLRLRVSQIRTSSGTGVVTASFSSEIRRLNLN